MKCKDCASNNVRTYIGELGIHFPGREGLTKPLVMVFPRLEVCLVCGSTNFSIPEEQLNLLQQGPTPPYAEARDTLPN